MKKILLSSALTVTLLYSAAQTIDDAKNLLQSRRYSFAIRLLDSLFQAGGDTNRLAYWLGQAYLQNNEPEKAIAAFKRTGNLHHSQLLWAGLAEAYTATEHPLQAAYLVKQLPLPADTTVKVETAMALGRLYTRQHEYLKAYRWLIMADRQQPKTTSILIALSRNRQQLGDMEMAESYCQQAINAEPGTALPFYRMARIAAARSEATKYIHYLQKAFKNDTSFPPALAERYRFDYYFNKEKSAQTYLSWLQSGDRSPEQEIALVALDFKAKKYSQVIERSSAILQNTDSSVLSELYRFLAYAYYAQHEIREAFQVVDRYLRTMEDTAVNPYDIYLSAQLAARLPEKDARANQYLWMGLRNDPDEVNKRFYALALLRHYISSDKKYASTFWREELLPLKEIPPEQMRMLAAGWYDLQANNATHKLNRAFYSMYPQAYKKLFMHSGIETGEDMELDLPVPEEYPSGFSPDLYTASDTLLQY